MLGRVVVLPEYRGQHLGSMVIKEAEKWIAELGYSEGYVMSGTTIRNGVSFLIAGLLIWCIARTIRENRDDERKIRSFIWEIVNE